MHSHLRSGLLATCVCSIFICGCSSKQAAAPLPGGRGAGRGATPVLVAQVTQKTVPINVTAIGTVAAYSTVSIKAQVSGTLMEAHFQEGDFVKKGQLLLTIDPRPYQASLAQAQAALARDKAVAANNRAQAKRYDQLLQAGVIAAQQAESFSSTADASDAVVSADEAAIQTAQINLEYCKIYSPIEGRTGLLMVKPGNLIRVADVSILDINQLNPIMVDFTLPQQYLADVKKYMAKGPLSVTASVPNDTGSPEQGTLTFIDNTVDSTTGTIHMRATFANRQNHLWPGVYVNVVLGLSKQADATVVPVQSVVQSQNGPLVFVVKADHTVEARAVSSSRTIEDEAVVEKGLSVDETIVVDGQALLVNGAAVTIKNNSGASGDPGARGSRGAAAPSNANKGS